MNWKEILGCLVCKATDEPSRPDPWRVVGYCDEPSVILENVDTKQQMRFGIGGLSAQGWQQLVRHD